MGYTYATAAGAEIDRAQHPHRTRRHGYGARGPIYRVMHAGEVLLEGRRCPNFEACRGLRAVLARQTVEGTLWSGYATGLPNANFLQGICGGANGGCRLSVPLDRLSQRLVKAGVKVGHESPLLPDPADTAPDPPRCHL